MLSIVLDTFLLTDGHFMDFVIFGDYIALPRYMGFKSVCGLGGYLGDRILGKLKF